MIGAPQKSLPQQMLGAREARRLRSDDFHETPPEAVEALLAVERSKVRYGNLHAAAGPSAACSNRMAMSLSAAIW
jgi:hypothetical protein